MLRLKQAATVAAEERIRGDDWSLSWTLSVAGAPLDLTQVGTTAQSQMRAFADSPDAVDFTVTGDLSQGVVTLGLTAAQTAVLEPGEFVFDVELSGSGQTETVLRGSITVVADVTR